MAMRAAAAEDVAAIRELVDRAYGPWVPVVGHRPGPLDEDYEALVEGGDVFVYTDEGAIVGLLVLRPDEDALPDERALMVENVAVDPNHQGRGLGPALLDFAAEQARGRGVQELRLYTHERMTSNIELYRRLGWEEYERRESNGFSRVFMRKRVT